jgi:hypothetical protein
VNVAILMLYGLVSGVMCSIAVHSVPYGLSPPLVVVAVVVFFGLFISRMMSSYPIGPARSRYLRIDLAFFLFFYVLYIHPYILDALGVIDSSYNRFIPNTFFENANKSLVASIFAVGAFGVGVGFGEKVLTQKMGFLSSINRQEQLIIFYKLNLLLGVGSLAVFVVTGGLSTLTGDYTGLGSGSIVTDGLNFIIGHFAAVTLATVFAIRSCGIYWRLAGLLYAAVWALGLLGAGDRNSFLLVAATGGVAYSVFVRPIGLTQLLLMGVLAYSGYNAVEYARSSGQRNLGGMVSAIIEGKSDTSSFDESSFSLTTVTARAAMEDISTFDVPFAKFKFLGFAGVVPFSRKLMVGSDDSLISSSDVFSEIIIGSDRTWSIGSGIQMDIIADMGVLFVPLVMFGVGWIAGRLQRLASTQDFTAAPIVFCIALPLFFEYPRYTLDFPARNLAWIFAGLFLALTWQRFFQKGR